MFLAGIAILPIGTWLDGTPRGPGDDEYQW